MKNRSVVSRGSGGGRGDAYKYKGVRPGVLRFMGSQRVGHNQVTELY